jgi:probable DNA repair protein
MAAKPLYDVLPLAPWLERGATVLTPNKRLARHIRLSWDERQRAGGARAWPTAPVLPVESWLLRRWEDAVAAGVAAPRRLLEPAAIRYLWQRVIDADRDASGGFSLLQPGEAARLAQRARDTLLRWRIDYTDEPLQQRFRLGGDSSHFLRWQQRFEAELDRLEAATAADCLQALLRADSPREPLLLVGCEGLSPLVDACLDKLGAPREQAAEPAREAVREVRCFGEQRDELRAVADWCAAEARMHPGARIGVVLEADPVRRAALDYQLRRAFGCIDANYHRLPVNYSAGFELVRAPLVRDALALLELLDDSVDVELLPGLLRSRFFAFPDRDTPAMTGLVTALRDLGSRRLDTGLLRHLAGRAGTEFGTRLLALREQRGRRRQLDGASWCKLFAQLLTDFGWPGVGLDSLEYQQHKLWEETLASFERCAALGPPLSLRAALRLLRECCTQSIFQPKTADSDVQVLGALEAAGLAFDVLWVCGMHARAWPAAARPNPLLPLSLQREHAMPQSSPEGELAFAARLLERYAGAVDRLVLGTALADDGTPLLPSPFLGELPAAQPPPPPGERAWEERRGQLALTAIEDSLAPPLTGRVRGGAGLLQAQAACPFQAFARYRLGLALPAEPVSGLTPLERGVLLHHALYALWGELGDSARLLALDEGGRHHQCEAAAGAAIGALAPERRQLLGPAFLALESERLVSTLTTWLSLEAERPQPFTVVERELRTGLDLAGLCLHLQLDRVDRLEDGSELVIDYKAGRANIAGVSGERISNPQLPLYSTARGDGLAGVAFAQLRSREERFVAIGRGESLPGMEDQLARTTRSEECPGDWPALRARWRDRLTLLASEVAGGEAAVAPAPRACDRCDFASLCRIDDAGADA